MARPGWYNENAGRDFPFIFGRSSTDVLCLLIKSSPDIFVDFGCVVGINADFVEGTHSVWLENLRVSANYIDFEFYSDAPGLQYHKLVFSRELTDNGYETEYAQAVLKEATSVSVPPDTLHAPYCPGDMLWEGYLVTKDVTKLAALTVGLHQVSPLDPDLLSIEPGLIQNLAGHYLSTVNAFNAQRVRAEHLAGCKQWCWADEESYVTRSYVLVDSCLTGDIRFAEGYNCTIVEDTFNNKITINAAVGKGRGQPPGEIEFFSGEVPPTYGNYLDGSIGCDEVVRSINGIEGPHIEIIGGQGVSIDTIPGQHLIIVKVDMQDLAGCFDQEASTSLSTLVVDSDPCGCGELTD